MHLRLLLFSFLLMHTFAYTQTLKPVSSKPSVNAKPPIDTTAIFNWPHLYNDCDISSNGNFIFYKIFNQPRDRHTLCIQSTKDTSWKKQIIDAIPLCFSSDEKQAIYGNRDTLFFLSLTTGEVKYISNVLLYKQPGINRGTWIAYQINDTKDVVLLNIETGQKQLFASAEDFNFSDNGRTLLLKLSSKQNEKPVTNLQWVNLHTKKTTTIWSEQNNVKLTNYSLDFQGGQLLFMVKTGFGNTVWYYQDGMATAIEKINEKSNGVAKGLQIASESPFFDKGGKYIFFKLQKPAQAPVPDVDAVAVDIWSYKDVQLISEQPKAFSPKKMTSVMSIDGKTVIQIEQEDEQIITSNGQSIQLTLSTDHLVVSKSKNSQFWWKGIEPRPYYVVSLKDGTRRELTKNSLLDLFYSPSGRFIMYFDPKTKNFISYEVATGEARNVTERITEKLEDEHKDFLPGRSLPSSVGIATWYEKDEFLIVYDNYDIWKVDPLGKVLPINLSNGYGKKNLTKLRLVYEQPINSKESILLTSFNVSTKFNGFCRVSNNGARDPEELISGPYVFYKDNSQIPNSDEFDLGMKPIKAQNKNVYLLKRQNFAEAPNYFISSNFKDYKPLTNIQPQKKYNWLSAELITYKQLDGTISQGILYKPENFDPSKKYPVLFSYYEKFSFRLYEFPKPDLNRGRIDISWYVGRSYLVFTPDIYYSIASISGKTVGDHAVDAIVGAAKYLSKLPYIDSTKMAIQGHSFAGGETNYIITHSNNFAAACEAAGGCNSITSYLSLNIPKGKVQGDKQRGYEVGQGRYGSTLWERPDLYSKGSSVLNADKVTTPLLIMHNQGDGAVDWTASVQMYLALRRLEKPVWMLQYDDEDHQIIDDKKAVDFTIRTNQFFDHYLKAEAAPMWMTNNVPTALKGVKNFISYDSSLQCSNNCKVCTNLHQ